VRPSNLGRNQQRDENGIGTMGRVRMGLLCGLVGVRGTESGDTKKMLFSYMGGIRSVFQGHSPGDARVCVMPFGGAHVPCAGHC